MTLRIPPIIQMLLCGTLGWGLSWIAPFLAFDGVGRDVAALLFFSAGAVILGLSVNAFIRASTTVNPLAPEDAETLVTSGLYRISRNPMYLAMALVLTGSAFLIGNLAAFAGPGPAPRAGGGADPPARTDWLESLRPDRNAGRSARGGNIRAGARSAARRAGG